MITFFKDLLKTKPKEAAASIIKQIYFDRNPRNQIKEISMEVEILNIAPTLENLLTKKKYQPEIDSIVKSKYSSNEEKIKELFFIIINEENRKAEIRVSNETNIYLLLLKKEYNLYYIPPLQPEVFDVPKSIQQIASSIKESSCQLFSKKNKKFIKFKLILSQDRICLMYTQKKSKEKNVQFSDIVSIDEKVIVDETKPKGVNMRLITTDKSHLIQFKNEYDYDTWLNIIKGKVNLWRENFIIAKYNNIEKENYQYINKSLDDIIENLFDLNNILSIDRSRTIFLNSDAIHPDIKNLFELIVSYKKSIQYGDYFDSILYYERVYSLLNSLDREKVLGRKILSDEYLEQLTYHKIKIENCKETIRKAQSEPIMKTFYDINFAFCEFASLTILDKLYNNIIDNVLTEIYEQKKTDSEFCKEIESVLLYYFEKENDYGLSDFIDIHGRVNTFVLNTN